MNYTSLLLKLMRNLVLFCLFGLLFSCSSIVKMINGEKKIKEETTASVQEFAFENQLTIDFKRNFYLKNRLENQEFASFKPEFNTKTYFAFPDVYFFHADGRFLEMENECYHLQIVNDEVDYFQDYLYSSDSLYDNSKQLVDFKNLLVNQQGEPLDSLKDSENDKHYAFVLWSKYKGKKWASETNFIIQQLEKSTVDFDIYFINMDLIDFNGF